MNENNNHNIADINISKEVETSFLDYSMSVIVSRALPDLRDGLKPVHRRIIYAMTKLHILSNTAYKKSARIVGEVIGKYHPHGDTSVYEAMVKIAQTFNYLHPLVEGQGNFGSIDGDSPAAMRYTEARLQKITNLFINDLDKNTVPFIENYDNSEKEPLFLPCSFPNLLVNGSYGIAVGLATNIPPHNLGEVIDAVIALVKNPNLNTMQLMDYIKGPDFPTNAIVSKGKGLFDAYEKGIGSVKVRAKTEIVKVGNRKQIIITEIPYRLNKAKLLEKIAELITKRYFTDIVDLRDESNRKGIKIVIELKKHSQEKVTLNKLLKLTPLQSSVNFNMVALDNNQPKLLSLKEILQSFINHYILVIVKRSKFEHNNCVKRLHILDGLDITLDNIDFVVQMLKASKNPKEASLKLQDKFKFSNEQVKAILEMKMQKLTNLEKDKIKKEIEQLKTRIQKLEEIISNKDKQLNILVKEQIDIKNKFAKPRKTELILDDIDIDNEALIKKEDILIVLSKNNYIKRLDAKELNTQKRRGKGSRTINKDFIIDKVIPSSTLDDILFFTNQGNVYKLRAYTINKYSSNSSKGLPIINLLPNLLKNEKIKTMIAVGKKDYETKNLLFFTKNGAAKKTDLGIFIRNRNTSMIAVKIKEDDELVNVSLIDKDKKNNPTILAASKKGKIVNVATDKLRLSGKTAFPLPLIKLEKNDYLVAGCSIDVNKEVILITENGIGKIINSKLRETSRNSKGVKGISLTSTSGKLQCIKEIHKNEDLIIVSKKGFIIRIDIDNLPSTSRTSQGNYLIKLEENDKVKLLETLKVDKN